MKTVEIRPFDKKRSEVLTDGALRFVLYNTEIRDLGMAKDRDIPEETLERIQREILPKRAKLRAMNLLQKRDYTEAKLREKLLSGGYTEETAEEALEYVRSYGYVDDGRYARDFIRSRIDRESRQKIKNGLMSRGIDRDLIESAMEEVYSDGLVAGDDPEMLQIRKLAKKKGFDYSTADYDERMKFISAAVRRGFSYEKVKSVLESLDI